MALICPLTHFYNINPKTKQLHRKERLIQPCVFSGGGTLCVLRQLFKFYHFNVGMFFRVLDGSDVIGELMLQLDWDMLDGETEWFDLQDQVD